MKTSLRKLRGFALHRHDEKDRRDRPRLAQLDELSQASQDMQDMKNCYDSLLSAAAATANSAYEFSESLREMSTCLLEKTALNDDEGSGKVLLMLGKVQFELQLLVDSYRSHIIKTITSPSESLLNELRTVEEMKRQCDEKRDIYEYIRTRQREKGRSRTTKGESFTLQQLQTARDDYDEEATLFVFRLKSLKQGQSRSLLTQAARHHAAQLFFFKKALKSLEAVEPHVKWITEHQHIDYHFNGLEDDIGEGDEDVSSIDNDSNDEHDDGELSFDYRQSDHGQGLSMLQRSMELDQVDVTFPQVETVKEHLGKFRHNSSSIKARAGSQSAPLFSENRLDIADKVRQLRPSSSRKFGTYALPTPANTRSFIKSDKPVSGQKQNLWYSTPLEEPKKYEKGVGDKKTSRHAIINSDTVLKESNNIGGPTRLPPPTERVLLSRHNLSSMDANKIKRQAFSGPLTGKSQPPLPVSTDHPQLLSGPLLRNPLPRSVSPVSPKFMSSPKISELHELPRPPTSLTLNSTRPSGFIGHSSPLTSKDQLLSTITNTAVKAAASPLPAPPQTINRSFSTPSRDASERLLRHSKLMESVPNEREEDIPSPTLSPISLSPHLPSRSQNIASVDKVKGVD